MAPLISFLSLNVGGSSSLAGLCMTISLWKFDVILLQEIKSTQSQLDSLISRLGFSSLVNIDPDDMNKPGTALIWRNSIPLTGAFNLLSCRLQMAEIGGYRIFNCYAPSGSENKFSRNKFYGDDLFMFLNLFPEYSLLVAGDYNSVLRREDIENGTGFSSKFCAALDTLVKWKGLVDCHLQVYQSIAFTFHRPGKAKSRLDRFYVSGFMSQDSLLLIIYLHYPTI